MYSLLMSGIRDLWDRSPATFPRDRVFEHTEKALAERFSTLTPPVLDELLACPALFAYESSLGVDARVGEVRRVRERSGWSEVRIEFELDSGVPGISSKELKAMAWELDINDSEFSRTHWAVKDVRLFEELAECGVPDVAESVRARIGSGDEREGLLHSHPRIFRVPQRGIEKGLVSVMRPFSSGFDPVMVALEEACDALALQCRDVNMEWHESEIIQDVFSLLYRSEVVICDFSEQNPNVFYEAGIAHTLGRPVIPIVRDPHDIPFDLRHHRYLKYETSPNGLREMVAGVKHRLRSLMSAGERRAQ